MGLPVAAQKEVETSLPTLTTWNREKYLLDDLFWFATFLCVSEIRYGKRECSVVH